MSGYEDLIASKGTDAPAVETPPVVDVASEPAPVSEAAPSEAPPVEAPAAAAPPAQAEPQDPMAPVKALLDERDRRQAAERRAQETARELAAIRARDAEQQRKAQEAANQLPHPLDDPEGFAAGVRALTNQAVRQVQSQTQEQQDRVVETLSRNALKRHIGNEQFSELEKFAQAAPDQAHNLAYESGDPWGWMYEKLQEAKKHRQAQTALQELGDKSLQDRIAEAVAAERAKWEAENGGGQPQPEAQPARPAPPQGPDGKFISPSQTQRHQPPSLSVVAAAPAPRGEEARGGYEQLFKRG